MWAPREKPQVGKCGRLAGAGGAQGEPGWGHWQLQGPGSETLWVARPLDEVVLTSARLSALSQGSRPGAPASGGQLCQVVRRATSGAFWGCTSIQDTAQGPQTRPQPWGSIVYCGFLLTPLSHGGACSCQKWLGPGVSLPHGKPILLCPRDLSGPWNALLHPLGPPAGQIFRWGHHLHPWVPGRTEMAPASGEEEGGLGKNPASTN